MSNSYEELRDEATGEGGEAWRAADREESNLRALYRELKDDPRYSEEHKAETAWARYEAAKEKIAAGKAKARELLQKQARTNERFSLPFPDGEGPVTTDTNKLLASQNEQARIVRQVERRQKAPGPFKPDVAAMLKEEYGRGLEVGGVQGGATCRGVLEAARELGVDGHTVVEGFRKDRHRESFERAEHSERLVQLIGGRVPEPPFARPGSGGRGSDFHTGRTNSFLAGRKRTAEAPGRSSGRRPPWS